MATAAQIAANQKNAQLSTGPRTGQGKHASARNSTRHGMCSREFVVLEGEQEFFHQLMADLQDDLQPANTYELELFRLIAHAAWTLRRCRLAEAALLGPAGRDPIAEFGLEDRLRQVDLYFKRAERTFHQASKTLREVQTERRYREEICSRPADEEEPSIHSDAILVSYARIMPAIRAESAAGRRESSRQFQSDLEAFLAPPVLNASQPSKPRPQSAAAGA
ncbi:MAG: hypothetical protein HY821_14285 [Acidobacteria bacterium]|nr:hypothetical protein [Acidobacteriota bacterium]